MAYKLAAQTRHAASGLTTFEIYETRGGRNTAIYVIVPPQPGRKVAAAQLAKTAKAAAKKALKDAASVL
jgi:hypothetical protein